MSLRFPETAECSEGSTTPIHAAAMFEIGASLREARSRRGLSSADVQKALRIRERYLTALEEERWELLPGEAYTKGFLRTYAEFLGLDGQLYIDEYNARFAQDGEEPLVPGSLAGTGAPRGMLRTVVAVLSVGAAVAGVAAWRLGGSPDGVAVPAPSLAVSAAAAAPLPKAEAKAESAGIPAATPPPAAKHVRAVISATRGSCWLSVRIGGAAGREIFRGFVHRGETRRFDVGRRLWVRLGNPPAVDVTLGGRPVTGMPNAVTNLLLTRNGPQPA